VSATCCPLSLWQCVMCTRDTCAIHDPSPGEARGICERCAPIFIEENE
jgi:hypothetical protein